MEVRERNVDQRIWKVIQKTGGRRYLRPRSKRDDDYEDYEGFGASAAFTVDCCYIDFDGERLGPVTETFRIPSFDNKHPIKSLNVCPLAYNADTKSIEALKEMGELFLERIKVQHLYYSGRTLARQPSGSFISSEPYERAEILANLESAVVVDFGMTFQFQAS